MVRVMGGSAKGRRLKSPEGLTFRPTTGRVKEFLFNILQFEVGDAVVLDLFSGTGSLGIEALSRGAAHVTFVEQSSGSLRLLRENLAMCGFEDRATILQGDVFQRLRDLGQLQRRFKIVLADPPFKMNYRQEIAETVAEQKLLDADARLIIEHEQHDPDLGLHALNLIRQKRFGACWISIYQESEE